MALSQFATAPLSKMIRHLAGRSSLTVVVGAGVSAEAGLPTWNRLVSDLLDRAGRERLALSDDGARATWIAKILGGESPLGAAAMAEALAGDDLANWIPEALYGADAARFAPGPIARQLPVLRAAYGPALRLMTTNYDDLVEQALTDALPGVAPCVYTGPAGLAALPETDADHQRVVHLHGYLARDGHAEGTVVLTERDYQHVATDDWQRSVVGSALIDGSCLFIGSSLTDPNLLRYLHAHAGPGSPQHYAIFTRQDAYPKGTPPEVIDAYENALKARWRSNRLEIVFVDHYAEIALALAEIARAKRGGASYRPLPGRLADWHAQVADELLLPPDFAAAQDFLHFSMNALLHAAVGTLEPLVGQPVDEVLSATLWLVDAAGDTLTNWATTDRVHRDPRTIDPIPIDEHSRWVAVRCFCRGTALGEPRNVYASRWHFVRGLPLVTRDGIPAGAITISSMLAEDETILNAMDPAVEVSFDDTIQELALYILDLASIGTT
ncbi:SIR2 family protein [Conexibacter woesei]|uniref:SIR2 family protein n=1 Tax=Conexibacter woesei TaxID=191495 RepID=UPI0004064735|nr:SIR2 family protein [Conexibacter woesei]